MSTPSFSYTENGYDIVLMDCSGGFVLHASPVGDTSDGNFLSFAGDSPLGLLKRFAAYLEIQKTRNEA